MAKKEFTLAYETEAEARDGIKAMKQGQQGYSETYVVSGPRQAHNTLGVMRWWVTYETYSG